MHAELAKLASGQSQGCISEVDIFHLCTSYNFGKQVPAILIIHLLLFRNSVPARTKLVGVVQLGEEEIERNPPSSLQLCYKGKPAKIQEAFGQVSQAHGVTPWGGPIQGQEFDLVILLGPFQYRIFYDLRKCSFPHPGAVQLVLTVPNGYHSPTSPLGKVNFLCGLRYIFMVASASNGVSLRLKSEAHVISMGTV